MGALVEFDALDIANNYFFRELPYRVLDALFFGLFGGTIWLVATGGARRQRLSEFLDTHALYLERLKRVVDVIRSKGNAKTFRDVDRRELNDTLKRLKAQQLRLFATLPGTHQEDLLEYFRRIDKINDAFDFSLPSAMINSGPLVYMEIDRFKGNIRQLFEPDEADGAATDKPVEQACLALERIVRTVYAFWIFRISSARKKQGQAVDKLLGEVRTSVSTASAEPRDWGVADFANQKASPVVAAPA